jgi:hypothetical protein
MSKEEIWSFLEAEHNKYPQDFGFPISNINEIRQVEHDLAVSFSRIYIMFIEKYNHAFLPSYTIYGIRPIVGENRSTVFDKTLFYKETQKWPGIEDWYVISDDGCGNPIGIDPEGRVWLSDHDSGFEKVKLADDFEEFLYRVYTETLYED